MTDIKNLIQPLMDIADRENPPEPEDYLDEEGFLVCGKCHQRRECIAHFPLLPEGKRDRKVKILCACRAAELERTEELDRQMKKLERINQLRAQSLMDSRLKDASFDTFQKTKDNERNLKLCKGYAKRFDKMVEKNQGLLFYGGPGTGKTFAAACIANYLLEKQKPVIMTSFVKLLDAMRGFDNGGTELIAKLNNAQLLIIDDLGAERGTDFAVERVYDIIDSRYRARLPMILTTNLSLYEMKATTDIRYARIYDRVFEQCYPMEFTGKSWRKAEASRRYREMESLLEGNDG